MAKASFADGAASHIASNTNKPIARDCNDLITSIELRDRDSNLDISSPTM